MFTDYILTLILGALLGAGMVLGLILTPTANYYKAKKECEKELPRTQHCIAHFIPEKVDGRQVLPATK